MSTDAFSDLTGLSTGPQPMRAKQTGMMKVKKSAADLLASVSTGRNAGSSGAQRPPRQQAQAPLVHDLSDLEQPSSHSASAPATDAFDLFQDLALPSGEGRGKSGQVKVRSPSTSLAVWGTMTHLTSLNHPQAKLSAKATEATNLPSLIPVIQQASPPTPPVATASPVASATAQAVPDYHDLVSDAATSHRQPSVSGSSSWSPREASQAVFFQIDDDPQRFPGHEPKPLTTTTRSRSSSSQNVPTVSSTVPAPRPTQPHPRPSLLDTSDAGLGSDLDSSRTQWLTPAASIPTEASPADAGTAMHDLLGGFGAGGNSAPDLISEDVFGTPAATPAGGGSNNAAHGHIDLLGLENGAAPARVAPVDPDAGPPAAADIVFGGIAGGHDTAMADGMDDGFFTGAYATDASAAAGGGAACVGLPDGDWLAQLTEPAAARAAPRAAAGPAQPEEAGDVMLARVVAEAHAAMATLPADRSQRVHCAILQAEEYIEEQMVAKKRVPGVTADGLRYARRSAARTAAQILGKTVAHHAREAAQEAEIAEGVEYRDEIKASIKEWAFRGGTRRGLRNLLVDLDKVLWEGAVWQRKKLAEVSTDADLRKTLNKARLLLHTDRMSGQPQKVKLRAELILIEIDKALKGAA